MPRALARSLLPALTSAVTLTAALLAPPATGAAPTDPDFLKVSRAPGGVDLNGVTFGPDLSANGRWVVYDTGADNVGPNDMNNSFDVALFDTETRRTRLLTSGTGDSFGAQVADSGLRVLFQSRADDLVAGDGDGQENAFVWDRQGNRTRRVDVARGGGDPDAPVEYSALSADGRWVAFTSAASNLVARHVRAGVRHLYLRDLRTGRTRVLDPTADGDSFQVSVDGHGRRVAVVSDADNLTGSPSGTGSNVLLWTVGRDRPRDLTPGNGFADGVDIADGGSVVAFSTTARLLPADSDAAIDVYRRDIGRSRPELVSVGAGDAAQYPSVSPDGRYVAFDTSAALVALDANGQYDCYRWDSRADRYSRMNKGADAGSGNALLARDGRFAAYLTDDLEFFPDDDNGFQDVARRRFRT